MNPKEDYIKVDEILEKHKSEAGGLVGILADIQRQYRFIPKEALLKVSKARKIPLSRLCSLATFYSAFSLTPKGEEEICVCLGTACHIRGAPLILEELERRLKIKSGETSKDGKYTLQTVRCVGACALGPVAVINGKYHGHLTPSKAAKLIKK